MPEEKTIPIREFARRIEVHEATVRKAIRTGKIVAGVVHDEQGRPSILESVALQEWGKSYNPNYGRDANLYAKLDKAAGNEQQPEADKATQPATGRSLADLKRLRAEVQLQREALELRKLKGELVEKATVYANLFAMGQEVRNAFETIPDRVTDAILAAPTRNQAHEILTVAITEALDTLASVISREK